MEVNPNIQEPIKRVPFSEIPSFKPRECNFQTFQYQKFRQILNTYIILDFWVPCISFLRAYKVNFLQKWMFASSLLMEPRHLITRGNKVYLMHTLLAGFRFVSRFASIFCRVVCRQPHLLVLWPTIRMGEDAWEDRPRSSVRPGVGGRCSAATHGEWKGTLT